eukprot:497928-Pyramimonas_sp.AAC.1
MEVFPPPRIAPADTKNGAPVGEEASWDLKVGWDAAQRSEVDRLWETIRTDRPEIIWLRSECRAISAINRLNRDRMGPEGWRSLVRDGLRDLFLCMRIADYQ